MDIGLDLQRAYDDGYKKGREEAEAYALHCGDETPITNADRIRSMTDEELAEFVAGTDFCELLCNDTPVCIDGQCFARLFKWLQQEAKDA